MSEKPLKRIKPPRSPFFDTIEDLFTVPVQRSVIFMQRMRMKIPKPEEPEPEQQTQQQTPLPVQNESINQHFPVKDAIAKRINQNDGIFKRPKLLSRDDSNPEGTLESDKVKRELRKHRMNQNFSVEQF